jgi:signal transduction histidine kinase/ligand-binding sensor domain-containing protein
MARRVPAGCLPFRGALLAAVFLAAVIQSAAQSTLNYLIRVWPVESGLPQSKVTAALQSPDGYVWVCTYGGLARFDGVRFTTFDDHNTPALVSSRLFSLTQAPDGALWIGDESGHLTREQEGRFFRATPRNLSPDWQGGRIYDLACDAAGDLWLLNDAGQLARPRDGRVLESESGSMSRVVALARTADGTLWVAHNGRLSQLQNGRLTPLEFSEAESNHAVLGFGPSRDGALWIVTGQSVGKWKDGHWLEKLTDVPWTNSLLTRLIETRDGILAAATVSDGLYLTSRRAPEETLHFNHLNGLPSDWISSLFEDREGNLWAGTGGGLVMLRRSAIQTIAPPDHWQSCAVLALLAGSGNSLWIGTEGAGIYRWQDGAWTHFGAGSSLSNLYVWSLAKDAAGRLYAGTWGGGLFVKNGGHFQPAPGTEDWQLAVPALLPARDGGLWVGTSRGLLHYQNGKIQWLTDQHGASLRNVRSIAEGSDGSVWFGTAGQGLGCWRNGQLIRFRRSNGLVSDFIECLRFDAAGALWIGTYGGGLMRWKSGRFSSIGSEQGLPNGVISDIEPDDRGFFWMSSHDGILRVSQAELNDCADGKINWIHCLVFGVHDGLPTIECSEGLQPDGARTADGRLWFGTSKGLVAVAPDKIRLNPLPPPVRVENLLVDGRPVSLPGPLQIPPGSEHLEFQFTALSLAAPEKVRFKYRLEGLEKGWVNAGTRRAADYHLVPPGRYTFHVIACNNDGVWNETGASLPLTLLPYFWQTWWFHVSSGLATVLVASAGVWFYTRRRMQLKLERLERQRALERERARIARDLHDDLGAALTQIGMLSQNALQQLDQPASIAPGLRQIFDAARALTRALDEIVWAVNPRHDSLDSLATYLARFAQEFLRPTGLRCRLELPLELPPWLLTAEIRHNVFLACKEALNNVVKHAAARQVRLALTLDPNGFRLEIADDGQGFDPSQCHSPAASPADPDQANGLENMRRRLQEIGGTCEIQSEPGRGTRVIFAVNLPAGHRIAASHHQNS